MDNRLKIALPKGRLLNETAALLDKAGWGLSEYTPDMRSYRLSAQNFPNLLPKVFQEKDIPIQVAVGNYDLGICGLDWVDELLAKYPSSALVKLRNLGYGTGAIFAVASPNGKQPALESIRNKAIVRIASEYPNLAESYALGLRLRRFSIFPVWGAAEAYPPESADLALIAGREGTQIFNHGLLAVDCVSNFNACLIANKNSWEKKDLSALLASLEGRLPGLEECRPLPKINPSMQPARYPEIPADTVRLALPDGHQQSHTLQLLTKAGIKIEDYPSSTGNRRPQIGLPGVTVKVIRPQDMPLQVANGNFDVAVTGRDWLTEHLNQFPSSPVAQLLDLKSGKVRMVAVVSNDWPVTDAYSLQRYCAGLKSPVRVASEYVNIADKNAQDNHLGTYRVIPTWGATEAFLPEDADLLIENTETGRTIARHNLKIIDTLFESTACLVGNKISILDSSKNKRINTITEKLRTAVEDAK